MIETGKKVKLHYTLKVEGTVVDTTRNGPPKEYIHGGDDLLAGLQVALAGLHEGDRREIVLEPEDGYGPVDPSALVEVARAGLPAEEIEVGMVFDTKAADGQPRRATVSELRGDRVLMDFNHPLAGQQLHFDVEVVGIRG
jgi:FKBP-type peptidyl-prolyl cis-trans isomerase SlyD